MRKKSDIGSLVLVSIAFLWALCAGGCIEMTMKTRIHANGSCSEAIQLSTNAMFAEGIKSELDKKDLAKEGYRVETKTEGEKVLVVLSRDYKSVEDMYTQKRLDPVSGVNEDDRSAGKGDGRKPTGELKVEDFVFVKTMTFRETMPGTGKNTGPKGKDRQMEEMQRKFASSMFTFKRVIEMPGPIISSNADAVDKTANTATWNVPFDTMDEGVSFEVKSRFVNVPAIIVSVAVLLTVIIVVILMATRKRSGADIVPDGESAV